MKLRCLIFALFTCATVYATELPPEQFLQTARTLGRNRSWGEMSGTIAHLRRDAPRLEAQLYMGILFAKEQILAQIVIDGKQGYYVGQSYINPSEGTSVLPVNKQGYSKPLLPEFGIRPQDLAMSFIYWQLVSELERKTVKGAECRVFILKDYKTDEQVKVYFSNVYYFPLKVEWFKDKQSTEIVPYRTLEVSSFKKEKDFWLVSNLNLFGPGWRTKIDFTQTNAGLIEQGIPQSLFKELPNE